MSSAPQALRRALATISVATAVVTATPPAGATFAEPGFQLEEIGAFTLRGEELKIGPTAVRYGLTDGLQLGTSFGLNLLGALNADLKWRIYTSEVAAIAVESGLVYFNPELLGVDSVSFDLTAVPLKVSATFTITEDLLLHVRADALIAEPDNQAPDAALRLERFLGPIGRLAADLFVEWRLSDHFALITGWEVPLIMHDPTLLYDGEDPQDRGAMMRASTSLFGTFESFSFRLGAGYGPSFLGRQGIFPVLDLYWRVY